MAIKTFNKIVPLSSFWTTRSLITTVRNLIDELDNKKVGDDELRHYINICVSAIVNQTAEDINVGDYGLVFETQLDTISPIPCIDLSTPAWTDTPKYSLGESSIHAHQAQNVHLTPFSSYENQTSEEVTNSNIFYKEPDQVSGKTKRADYESYFIPSTVITKITDIGFEYKGNYDKSNDNFLPSLSESVAKASMSEILYYHKNFISSGMMHPISQVNRGEGAVWTYFANKIYFYFGEGFKKTYPEIIKRPATVPMQLQLDKWVFHIFAIRTPMLDNLKVHTDENSGWWQHIDLPDRHIRLLTLMIQKMVYEKIGKRVSVEVDQTITQLLGQLGQGEAGKLQAEAAARMKVEQGFQSR